LHNKDQQGKLFKIYLNNLSSICFESITYSSSGGSFTVYAAYGIYRASRLTSFDRASCYSMYMRDKHNKLHVQ